MEIDCSSSTFGLIIGEKEYDSDRKLEVDSPGKEAKTKVTILFWTGYWIWSHFGQP